MPVFSIRMRAFYFLLWTASAFPQVPPPQDSRNTEIPDTDTHFAANAHGHFVHGRLEHTVRENPGETYLASSPGLCINFARQGYVVFAWDMVGYNDTTQTKHHFGGPREQLWAFGPLGLQLWNSTRALDFVQSLPDVDSERIAMTGASGGGTQTFLLTAIDDRVKVSAPVNMVSAIMQGGSQCENAPNLRIDTYNVEIAATMGPRPRVSSPGISPATRLARNSSSFAASIPCSRPPGAWRTSKSKRSITTIGRAATPPCA